MHKTGNMHQKLHILKKYMKIFKKILINPLTYAKTVVIYAYIFKKLQDIFILRRNIR